MIGRLWQGTCAPTDADAYEDHLRRATLPALRQIAGYEGGYVLRREAGGGVDFLVLTLWVSLDAVRAFAGDDCELAVVPPEAERLLTHFDQRALHYDVARAPPWTSRRCRSEADAMHGAETGQMHQWQSRQAAAQWDAQPTEQLPTRAEQQEILLTLLAAAEIGDGAVLDLGVGSGLVAEAVLETLPEVELVGIDFSEAMLELAHDRRRRFGPRVHLLRHDLAEAQTIELPALRYAAAFSVQTLHHLSDAEKTSVIAWMARVVEPGGVIVVIDRMKVAGPLFREWAAVWRRLGVTTPPTYAEHVDELEHAGDRPALLEDQLAWMAAAGLDATCLHAYGNRAVLVGRKPNP
jgi:ubiquinone/menaquinone biosynthesis C-methylase UbiE/heme-degrading monooxygenase HmoA